MNNAKNIFSLFIFAGFILSACSVDVGLLAGKQCDADMQCAEGYTCELASGICLPSQGSACSPEGNEFVCGTNIGACTQGIQKCENGHWSACSGKTAKEEACNDLDDDCDGETDEAFGYKGQQCAIQEGTCVKIGEWVCNQWFTDLTCEVPAEGSPEICDGNDNDCDGIIDNIDADSDGYYGCSGVDDFDCDDTNPDINVDALEQCNDIDDNCDGETDEDWPQLGQDCVIGTGGCSGAGTWQCKSTYDGIKCSAIEGTGYDEVCDGVDNNCDGETDENFPELGMGCYAGIGICRKSGNLICSVDGLSLTCNATPGQPENEADFTCDGLDHNCDGLNNNGIDEDSDGFEKCTGVLDCNDDPESGSEIYPGQIDTVGDGIDNDCDGLDGVDNDGDNVASNISGGNDCDDSNPLIWESVSGYIDLDGDTYGDENASLETFCTAGDLPTNYVYNNSDCIDNPALGGSSIYPGASETCNNVDNNCSGDESDASDIGDDEHCTACYDDCTVSSYTHGVDPRCNDEGTACDFSCDSYYYDVDGDSSNGCEVRDDRNGSNTSYNFGTIDNCGEDEEYSDGRLPEDDRIHVPAQKDTPDRFTFYYDNQGGCDNDFGMRYATYCNPDSNSQVKFGIYSDGNCTNLIDSRTVTGTGSGSMSPNISSNDTYYIKVENVGSIPFRGKYAIGVYDEESGWDFTGWGNCNFD